MKKIFALILIAVFTMGIVAAEGAIGTSNSTKATLTLSSDNTNTAEVGFYSDAVTGFDMQITSKGEVKLAEDTEHGTADNTGDPLWVYARIQSVSPCNVKISVPGALRGFDNSNAAGTGPWEEAADTTKDLGWKITTPSADESPDAIVIDVAANDDGTKEKVMFEHEGTPATKVYSARLNIETDDYRGKAANYFVQNIKVEVVADSQT